MVLLNFMSWWFHLLVRRVDSLRERRNFHERLVRAVGAVAYGERYHHLLLQVCAYSADYVRYEDADGVCHRPGDLPALVWADGSRIWNLRGTSYRRPNGEPYRDIHRPYHRPWERSYVSGVTDIYHRS